MDEVEVIWATAILEGMLRGGGGRGDDGRWDDGRWDL